MQGKEAAWWKNITFKQVIESVAQVNSVSPLDTDQYFAYVG